MIKESTTHSIEQAGQWPTSVALDTPTLIEYRSDDVIKMKFVKL